MNEFNISFDPSDKIDTRAIEIHNEGYGLRGVFISNELPLELLQAQSRVQKEGVSYLQNFSVLGHRFIPFGMVPAEDKASYAAFGMSEREQMMSAVWYPQVSKNRERYILTRLRIEAVKVLERKFGVNLKDLKSIDRYPVATIADAAAIIDSIELEKLKSLRDLE